MITAETLQPSTSTQIKQACFLGQIKNAPKTQQMVPHPWREIATWFRRIIKSARSRSSHWVKRRVSDRGCSELQGPRLWTRVKMFQEGMEQGKDLMKAPWLSLLPKCLWITNNTSKLITSRMPLISSQAQQTTTCIWTATLTYSTVEIQTRLSFNQRNRKWLLTRSSTVTPNSIPLFKIINSKCSRLGPSSLKARNRPRLTYELTFNDSKRSIWTRT